MITEAPSTILSEVIMEEVLALKNDLKFIKKELWEIKKSLLHKAEDGVIEYKRKLYAYAFPGKGRQGDFEIRFFTSNELILIGVRAPEYDIEIPS